MSEMANLNIRPLAVEGIPGLPEQTRTPCTISGRIRLPDHMDDGSRVLDPEPFEPFGERLDLVTPNHTRGTKALGRRGDVRGEELQPDLGLTQPVYPVDPELIRTE